MSRSGRIALSCAWRRRLLVPTRAFCGRSSILVYCREQKASRGSSRSLMAAISNPGGSSVGRSFNEWTARSTRPAARASSISLVKIPLPNPPLAPTIARGTSVILSPVVWMISISTWWPRARSRAEMGLACHRASWEPRGPTRGRGDGWLATGRVGNRGSRCGGWLQLVRCRAIGSFGAGSRPRRKWHFKEVKASRLDPINHGRDPWGGATLVVRLRFFLRHFSIQRLFMQRLFVRRCSTAGLRGGAGFLVVEVEEAADYVNDGGDFGFFCGSLQRGDGGVHDFVDDAAGQGFDGDFLFGGHVAEAAAHSIDFGLANGFEVVLQAHDCRHNVTRVLAGFEAGFEVFDFAGDDGFGALGFFAAVGDVAAHGLL